MADNHYEPQCWSPAEFKTLGIAQVASEAMIQAHYQGHRDKVYFDKNEDSPNTKALINSRNELVNRCQRLEVEVQKSEPDIELIKRLVRGRYEK